MQSGTHFGSMVLGTMTFGDTVDLDGARALLDVALDAGITHLDTANSYSAGDAERMLAELLAGRRDRVTVATKAGMYLGDADGHSPLSPEGLRLSLEASLARLGVEHVDLYYLHQPDRAASLHDTLSTVAKFVAEGPTQNELKAAKDNLIGGFPLLLDSNRKLIGNVANIAWNDLPLDYLDTWTARMNAVTAADIKAAFARKLQPDRMVTVVVGSDPQARPQGK